ncbi:MAG: hypothetical protein H2056_02610 [Sphingopyxis sp.]|nr:hypothetical protein [Sphingopyxis sp.]
MNICYRFGLPFFLMLSSCATDRAINLSIPISNSYKSCTANKNCTVSGAVTKKRIGDIDIGIFSFNEKECIALSFSKGFFRKNNFPINGTFTGKVFQWEHDPLNYVLLKINGRKVPYSPCKETYLFIE